MGKQKGNELGDGMPEEETGGSKKDGKEDTKAEPPGPPPIGLIELVRFASSSNFQYLTPALQFKFSTPLDAFLIIFGLSMALACGSSMPILCILFGDTLQVFQAILWIVGEKMNLSELCGGCKCGGSEGRTRGKRSGLGTCRIRSFCNSHSVR